MGSVQDPDLLLVTAPAEEQRAREFRAQQIRQENARRARERLMYGSAAARRLLAYRWAAVTKSQRQAPAPVVYEGEGPPPVPVPANTPVGAWYHDTLTDELYQLEAYDS